MHKPVTLGKPVVSSVEFHTGKISKFVDHYLQPHAKALPLYIKDISGFINKISQTENLIKYTFLVTLNRIKRYICDPVTLTLDRSILTFQITTG